MRARRPDSLICPLLHCSLCNCGALCAATCGRKRTNATAASLPLPFLAFARAAQHSGLTPPELHTLWRWSVLLDFSEAEALFRLHHLGHHLRKFVARDRAAHLQQLADNVQAHDLSNAARLFESVRKAFPSTRSGRHSVFQPLPAVQAPDGRWAMSTQDRLEVWRTHFARQEAGVALSSEQYLDEVAHTKPPAPSPVFDLRALPSLREIEALILGLRRSRAAGADSISSEILQLRAPLTARQLLPVFLKSGPGLREPIPFRGGELVTLAKRAGAAFQTQDFRSILISSVPGKIYHRKIREQLLGVLGLFRHPLHSGAFPGEGIERICLAAKTFQLQCDALRHPWALTFVDLQAAFYQVVREAVAPGCHDDAALLRLLHSLHLPSAAYQELRHHLEQMALLPAMGASPHVTALVNDLFRGTYFYMMGGSTLTLTRRGTRPGDPAADAIFSLAMAAYLAQVDQALGRHNLLPMLAEPPDRHPWALSSSEQRLGSPCWADDFVQPSTAASPQALIPAVQATAQLLTEQATSMGMTLSFGPSKTATLLPPWAVGPQTPGVLLDKQGFSYIPVTDRLLGVTHELRLVQAYKHLGGITVANCSPIPDLQHRHARAAAVVRPLKKRLFGCRQIPLSTRRVLLQSLAMSKFVHTAAAIVLPAAIHRRLWAQHYVALWRALFTREQRDKQTHAYRVLHAARAPSPPLAIAKSRASFLRKLSGEGPTLLTRLLYDHWALHPRSSWLGQIHEDVQQVCLYLPNLASIFSGRDTVRAVLDSLLEDPAWWLQQVMKAIRVFQADLTAWVDGTRLQPEATVAAPPSSRPFPCPLRSSTFELRKHLGVHLARRHAVLAPTRHFAPTTFCLSCHKDYGSVARVQMHLKSHDDCLRRVALLFPPMAPSDIAAVEASEKRAYKRQKAGCWQDFVAPRPAVQAYGPPLPTWEERRPPEDAQEANVLISHLIPTYVPTPATLEWVEAHIAGRSTEGPRRTAASFWDKRPAIVSPARARN